MGWIVRFLSTTETSDSLVGSEALTTEGVFSHLWDLGTNGIGELASGHVVAGFATELEARTAEVFLKTQLVAEIDCQPVDDQGWHDPDKISEAQVKAADGNITFPIKAGPSFGHGNHETTKIILDVLGRYVSPDACVLDIGTGSGVLAIAAKLLGGGATVAIDIDPLAVLAASENATRNNVEVESSGTAVDDLVATYSGYFDLIVTNVLLVAHREVVIPARKLLAPGGHMITSGYLLGQAVEVAEAYQPLTVLDTLKFGDWAGHIFSDDVS